MKYSQALVEFERMVADYVKEDFVSWAVVNGAAMQLAHELLSPHKKCECFACMGGKEGNA